MSRHAERAVSSVVLAVVLFGSVARACNTPVFRYAMLNWGTAPYRVFYFDGSQPSAEDQAVCDALAGLSEAAPAPANILLERVDVSQNEQLEHLPEVVRKAQQTHADGDKPLYLVFTPLGGEVFAGRLEKKDIAAMVASPARKRLVELLHEGHAAVLLVLGGADEQANQQAEKVAADVIASAAAGKIPTVAAAEDTYSAESFLPKSPDAPASPTKDDTASGKLKLTILKVSRSDPAEQWLVRCLLAVEADLSQYANEPMVFAVYGRGRAMPPCVGKGITAENLSETVAFLAGACSCMIKDENPGVELLVQWDWRKTVEALATEELPAATAANEMRYEEFVMPQNGAPSQPAAEDVSPSALHPAADAAPKDQPPANPPSPATDAGSATGSATVEVVETTVSRVAFGRATLWAFAVGLAALTAIVLVAGVVLIRRQRVD